MSPEEQQKQFQQTQVQQPQTFTQPAHGQTYVNQNQLPQQQQQDPGMVFGIISLVFILVFAPIGIIFAIIGLKKSKSVGQKNVPALIGLILNATITIVVAFILVTATIATINNIGLYSEKCKEIQNGTYEYEDEGKILTCESGKFVEIQYEVE